MGYLKESYTGHGHRDSKKQDFDTYRKVMMAHKSIVRAANNLEKKGFVVTKRKDPGFSSKAPQIEKIYLTKLGFEEATKWALGPVDHPTMIITEHTPKEINVYNESGLIGTYQRATTFPLE